MDEKPSLSRRRHAPKGPIKPHDDAMAPSNPMADRRCSARSKQTGHRCGQPAIRGGTVCRFHGGAAPQVKEAAMERLRRLQAPAVDRIAKLIDQDQFPTVAYAASKDVLDRTLGRATEVVDVTHSGSIDLHILDRLARGRQRNVDQHD